jgi:hypothetical protein
VVTLLLQQLLAVARQLQASPAQASDSSSNSSNSGSDPKQQQQQQQQHVFQAMQDCLLLLPVLLVESIGFEEPDWPGNPERTRQAAFAVQVIEAATRFLAAAAAAAAPTHHSTPAVAATSTGPPKLPEVAGCVAAVQSGLWQLPQFLGESVPNAALTLPRSGCQQQQQQQRRCCCSAGQGAAAAGSSITLCDLQQAAAAGKAASVCDRFEGLGGCVAPDV